MNYIISIETSTDICSVALSSGNELLDLRESKDEKNHASQLTVYIKEILDKHQLKAKNISAIAVSEGPGSYTGLRIGVSVAKGIAYAAGIKLIAVNTLQSMAYKVFKYLPQINPIFNNENESIIVCPTIDARRMEMFCAYYTIDNKLIKPCHAYILDENSFNTEFINSKIIFVGNAIDKVRTVVKNPFAYFISEVQPSAANMIELANIAFEQENFVDVAYFEPYYLKDFVATVSSKNILKKTV